MPATRSPRKARRHAEGGFVRTERLENRLLFATYNALSDFSTTANPNGAWTYGESTNGTFAADAGFNGTAWAGVGTANQSSIGTSTQAPGLVLKPGQSGGSADVRWTAPADGTYSISGNFNDFTGNATDDVRMMVNNGSPVVSGSVGPASGAGGATNVPITQNALVLKAGDTVDFVVGPGSDGWDTNDVVSLQATITTSTGTTGNTSPLTTTVTGKLPSKALVAGERVTPAFNQIVTLANSGTTRVTGPVTIELLLGLTPTGEAGDPMVTSISRRVNLAAGRSMRFPVLVKSMPTGANGDYFVVTQTTDPTGLLSTGASSGTITVKPAFVDLTGVAGNTPARAKAGRRITVPVTVTNAGNTQAKGPLDIDVVATSTTATVDLGTVTNRIVLNPGRRVRLLLVETLPTTMPAGTYTLNGTVDPNHAFNDPTITNNTFTAATPLVVS
jgi:hypothetical protein